MKNPLFRAYYEETVGIAQGRFLKDSSGENQKFILVSALEAVLNKGGCFYNEG